MTAIADTIWQAHIADRHQCCWIADYGQCGLWCGHDGDHLPFTPGGYLPPPMLHPLDILLLSRTRAPRCPVCGIRLRLGDFGYEWEVTHAFRHFEDGQWGEPELEIDWWFGPCGHEVREILPD